MSDERGGEPGGEPGDDDSTADVSPDGDSTDEGRPDVERRAARGRPVTGEGEESGGDESDDVDEESGSVPEAGEVCGSADDSGSPRAGIESKLDRASEADGETAREFLRSARADLSRAAGSMPDGAVRRLRTRIERLSASIEERDEYGAMLGSSMNPDDEDAP